MKIEWLRGRGLGNDRVLHPETFTMNSYVAKGFDGGAGQFAAD